MYLLASATRVVTASRTAAGTRRWAAAGGPRAASSARTPASGWWRPAPASAASASSGWRPDTPGCGPAGSHPPHTPS